MRGVSGKRSRGGPPVLCVTGVSGAGKTTLLVALIGEFRSLGLAVAALKHASKGFTMDVPGKDTFRMREAGAREVAAVGAGHLALLADAGAFGADSSEPDPVALAALLFRGVDLVLAEGFSQSAAPRVEILGDRAERRTPAAGAGRVLARVIRGAATSPAPGGGPPRFGDGEIGALARFLLRELRISSPAADGTRLEPEPESGGRSDSCAVP